MTSVVPISRPCHHQRGLRHGLARGDAVPVRSVLSTLVSSTRHCSTVEVYTLSSVPPERCHDMSPCVGDAPTLAKAQKSVPQQDKTTSHRISMDCATRRQNFTRCTVCGKTHGPVACAATFWFCVVEITLAILGPSHDVCLRSAATWTSEVRLASAGLSCGIGWSTLYHQ